MLVNIEVSSTNTKESTAADSFSLSLGWNIFGWSQLQTNNHDFCRASIHTLPAAATAASFPWTGTMNPASSNTIGRMNPAYSCNCCGGSNGPYNADFIQEKIYIQIFHKDFMVNDQGSFQIHESWWLMVIFRLGTAQWAAMNHAIYNDKPFFLKML